jgi:hypothetical protein
MSCVFFAKKAHLNGNAIGRGWVMPCVKLSIAASIPKKSKEEAF